MHYYKFNIADWHLGTSHLSLEEEAAYLRLINYYYDTEEPIPLETDRVFRRLRLGKGSDVGLSVLDEFFTKTKDGWIHERCDREIESYQEKADANRENGKKGGRPKKIKGLGETEQEPSGFSAGTQQEPTDNLNHEPLTTNQELSTKGSQKNKFSDEDMECAEWLFSKKREYIPDCQKANLNGWAEHVRKMREIDNRSHKEICMIWLWCRKDDFEAANVQSPEKLRKRYDQLKVKMRSCHEKHQQPNPQPRENALRRVERQAREVFAAAEAEEAGISNVGPDEPAFWSSLDQSGGGDNEP